MNSFTYGSRVTVKAGPLKGISGTVRRCRMADSGAWVEMDSIPEGATGYLFPFGRNTKDDRAKHTLLYPEDCR